MDKGKCPGQDLRYWTPKDIYELSCSHCGKPIEFFKDDLRRQCPHCGVYNLNTNNDLSCTVWCGSAEDCLKELGRDVPEVEPPFGQDCSADPKEPK